MRTAKISAVCLSTPLKGKVIYSRFLMSESCRMELALIYGREFYSLFSIYCLNKVFFILPVRHNEEQWKERGRVVAIERERERERWRDRKSTRLNSSHVRTSRIPSSA